MVWWLWGKTGKVRELAKTDLAPIRKLLLEKHGWSEEKALAVERGYRDFLTLMIREPGKVFSPPEDVDTFWHTHMLDSRRYAADCQRIFGRFIHHDPHLTKGSPGQVAAYANTLAGLALLQRGQEKRPPSAGDGGGCGVVPVAAACGGTSGGGGDGPASGGASCGSGSSCGGSSCGSSCGGGGCGGGGCGGGGCGGG